MECKCTVIDFSAIIILRNIVGSHILIRNVKLLLGNWDNDFLKE